MNSKVCIIAEAGVNHNGNMSTAKKMIEVAADSGADAIKFQTYKANELVIKNAEKAAYQKSSTDIKESQYDMLKKLELSYKEHVKLIDYSNKLGIEFLSTPFDLKSINVLNELGLKTLKIPSGEITNFPYLQAIGKLKKKIIMSTGMANLNEIKNALEVLVKSGTCYENITVLHANTEYPTPFEDVNLNAMLTIAERLGTKVGYSDHTLGIEIPIAATAMGAVVIEKHFTLDKNMSGPDHKASLEPDELKAMVIAIRNIEKAMGNGTKQPTKSEIKNIPIVRKSIVASKVIAKGEIFSDSNLTTKRPGTGISPMKWNEIIGQTAKRRYNSDDLIEMD